MLHIIKNNWHEILSCILHEYSLSNVSYQTWLLPLEPVHFEKDTDGLYILHIIKNEDKDTYLSGDRSFSNDGDEMFVDFINDRYSTMIASAIDMVLNIKCRVICSNHTGHSEESAKSIINSEKKYVSNEIFQKANINPKYKFDNFIVGPSNEMAHATSLAISRSLGDIYNPLFLYSGPGLGKTHLMHSIANYVLERDPSKKVLYVTSETFTNDLIESIKSGSTTKFRDKYRNIDMLLVDDIQFIVGKESTQEEFFHTFNTLYDAKKQIIISSDKPPKDLKTLDERLTSRFEWGIAVDIMSPNYETRMAILEQKEETEGITIDKGVLQYIAAHIKSNIRELEGALNKIIAMSKLSNNREINLELAQEVLSYLIDPNIPAKLSNDFILQIVADHFGIQKNDIISKKKTKEIARARHIAVYLCRTMTDSTLQEIGKSIGGRDHSTIINSNEYVEKLINENDSDMNNDLGVIRKKLSPQ